jgi:transcriptional antiterminator RfaH
MSDKMQWYLLQTKGKQEQRAVENLDRQGVHSFCPMIRVEKVSRGRRSESLDVLFPGYLFVQLGELSISATSVRSTRGVSHFVVSGGQPIRVLDSLIDELQQRVALSLDTVVSNLPKVGEKMQITEGPFKGLDAIFSQPDGASRAVVLITLLNQKIQTSLPFKSLSQADSA